MQNGKLHRFPVSSKAISPFLFDLSGFDINLEKRSVIAVKSGWSNCLKKLSLGIYNPELTSPIIGYLLHR